MEWKHIWIFCLLHKSRDRHYNIGHSHLSAFYILCEHAGGRGRSHISETFHAWNRNNINNYGIRALCAKSNIRTERTRSKTKKILTRSVCANGPANVCVCLHGYVPFSSGTDVAEQAKPCRSNIFLFILSCAVCFLSSVILASVYGVPWAFDTFKRFIHFEVGFMVETFLWKQRSLIGIIFLYPFAVQLIGFGMGRCDYSLQWKKIHKNIAEYRPVNRAVNTMFGKQQQHLANGW